jgi:hypothetical protein
MVELPYPNPGDRWLPPDEQWMAVSDGSRDLYFFEEKIQYPHGTELNVAVDHGCKARRSH